MISRVITRDEQVSRIKQMGQWIVNNADNILGEYPGQGIVKINVSCEFTLDCSSFDSIEIKREHLVGEPSDVIKDEKIYWDEYSYE